MKGILIATLKAAKKTEKTVIIPKDSVQSGRCIAGTQQFTLLAGKEENNVFKMIYIEDGPMLRAALAEKVDVVIAGNKDFLESGVKNPQIVTAAEFKTIYKK